jgi:hypothetical protein
MSILSRSEKPIEEARPGEAPALLAKAEIAAASVKEARAELNRREAEKAREQKRADHLRLSAQFADARERPRRVLTEAAAGAPPASRPGARGQAGFQSAFPLRNWTRSSRSRPERAVRIPMRRTLLASRSSPRRRPARQAFSKSGDGRRRSRASLPS